MPFTDTIELRRPDGLVRSPAFSHTAVVPPAATTIHVGGQNAVDADGALVGAGDTAAQTRQVLRNVRIALAAADADLDDVVSWTVLAAPEADLAAGYAEVAAVLDPDAPPPLVTAAVVQGLAVPGALVEIAVTAAVVR